MSQHREKISHTYIFLDFIDAVASAILRVYQSNFLIKTVCHVILNRKKKRQIKKGRDKTLCNFATKMVGSKYATFHSGTIIGANVKVTDYTIRTFC